MAKREKFVILPAFTRLRIYMVAALFSAILGPFNTYVDYEFIPRLGFWSFHMVAAWLNSAWTLQALSRSRWMCRFSIFVQIGVIAATSAVFMTYILKALLVFFAQPLDPIPNDLMIYVQTFFGYYLILSIEHLYQLRLQVATAAKLPPQTEVSEQPLEEQGDGITQIQAYPWVPARIRAGRLISVSMQDHYAEITTTKGRELILMRLSDVIKQVAPEEGIQVHRSHWVARDFMKELHKEQRKYRLELTTGDSVAVSASFVDQVIAALRDKRDQ